MHTTDTIPPSGSTINRESLETQNSRLLHYLQSGRSITFLDAMKIGIDDLHRRIPELKATGTAIHSRMIKVGRIDCKEYSLNPFTDK